MKTDELTQSLLKEYLTYCPSTGIFTANHDSKTNNALKADRELGSLIQGYKRIGINGVDFLAHRLAWLYTYGSMPELPLMLDHIDRNKTNNSIDNLRVVTCSENAKNTGLQLNNTSGYKGVFFHKRDGKWQAQINIKGIRKHLGYHETKEQAIAARKQAEIDYKFHEVKERKVV